MLTSIYTSLKKFELILYILKLIVVTESMILVHLKVCKSD